MKKMQSENLKLTESGQDAVLTADMLPSERVGTVAEPSRLESSTAQQRR
ncbi:MAG: hypothetical protein IJA41_01800 [Clostridia bacterium]|nr:hypothetical protein [Clostridia bacterium]